MTELAIQPTLVLIGGGAGSGKTSVARALATQFEASLLLDKDVVNSVWVDSMLHRLNGGQIDRESRVYREVLRPLDEGAVPES